MRVFFNVEISLNLEIIESLDDEFLIIAQSQNMNGTLYHSWYYSTWSPLIYKGIFFH